MPVGRKNVPQVYNEISVALNTAQVNSQAPVPIGSPGIGGVLVGYHLVTTAAFDATTVTLKIGYTAGGQELLAPVSIKALGRVDSAFGIAASGLLGADTPLYATATITGGPNTVGNVIVWLDYIPALG